MCHVTVTLCLSCFFVIFAAVSEIELLTSRFDQWEPRMIDRACRVSVSVTSSNFKYNGNIFAPTLFYIQSLNCLTLSYEMCIRH